MTTQPDQDKTLQEKLRADAASGECAKSTNLMLIAAADRLDDLERQLAEAQKDTERVDGIANEYFQIEAFAMTAGLDDDADVGWRIYQSHCGEEKPRLIVEQFKDDFRQAIDAAMKVKP